MSDIVVRLLIRLFLPEGTADAEVFATNTLSNALQDQHLDAAVETAWLDPRDDDQPEPAAGFSDPDIEADWLNVDDRFHDPFDLPYEQSDSATAGDSIDDPDRTVTSFETPIARRLDPWGAGVAESATHTARDAQLALWFDPDSIRWLFKGTTEQERFVCAADDGALMEIAHAVLRDEVLTVTGFNDALGRAIDQWLLPAGRGDTCDRCYADRVRTHWLNHATGQPPGTSQPGPTRRQADAAQPRLHLLVCDACFEAATGDVAQCEDFCSLRLDHTGPCR
jgi:hypothetical protein